MRANERVLDLVRLLKSEKDFKQISHFATALKVSQRTVQNDLIQLEELDKNKLLSIEKRQNNGIRLIHEQSRVEEFLSNFANISNNLDKLDRMSEIIRLLAVEDEVVTYLSLSETLYSSTTVIIKDIQAIRDLKEGNLEVQSDRNGTRISGSEYYRQKLIKTFYLNYIEAKKLNNNRAARIEFYYTIFENNVVDTVFEVIEEIEDVVQNSISQSYLQSLELTLLVITDRVKKSKHYVKDINELSVDYIETLTNFPYALSIIRKIETQCNVEFNDEEIRHISYQFFIHKIEVNVNSKYLEKMFEQDVRDIINYVSKELKIDLSGDTRLFNSLMFHIIPLNYRVRSNIKIQNPLYSEVVSANSDLFYIILMAVKKFENKYDINLNNDEISFISIHFQVALASVTKKIKAYIVCETGLLTSELLISKMKQSFPADLDVIPLSKEELYKKDVVDANFIITTVDLEESFQPFIKVSMLINDEDMRSIYDYYLKYRNHSYGEKTLNNRNYISDNILNQDHIFLNKKFKSKDEIFNHAKKIIKEIKTIKEGVIESIVDREKVGSTIIAKNVALPHSNPHLSDKTHMIFYTLDKPIKWDNSNYVQVVILFVLSISDNKKDLERFISIHEYMSDYKNVMNILSKDKEFVIKELEKLK